MVVMGRIVAPYGIKGWVKIQPYTETLDSLFDYEHWWLSEKGGWREGAVEDAKIHGGVIAAKFVGVEDRDQALALKGREVGVPREDFPEADEDEYYWSDLVGLKVRNQQDVELGVIGSLFETGANDVMVVEGERERLIPFVGQVVLEVDLEAGTMLVDWDADF